MAFNNYEKNCCNSSFPAEWNFEKKSNCENKNGCGEENWDMNCSCGCRWCQEKALGSCERNCGGKFRHKECDEAYDYENVNCDYDKKDDICGR